MSKSSDKRKAEQDLERAEQGGVIDPSEQVTDPANTGPAGANPEAEPAGSGGESATAERAEKERRKH